MKRRDFLAAAAAAPFASAQPKQRPNFLVLFTDDQRFDTVRALWGGQPLTPNMDRLARRGLSFTHACTQGGLTGAICMPSRAQLLTGRSVFRVHQGIIDHQAHPDPAMMTFPERLRREGYSTFATGKWHNGPVLFNRSFEAGSTIFFGGMADQMKTPVHDYDPTGKYPKERASVLGRFSSELFADAAVEFLSRGDTTKPFLLYVAFTSPHDPRMAPERFTAMFPADKATLPANFLPQHPFDNGDMKVRDELLAGSPRTPDEIRQHLAGYFAMIAEVDAQIGRVLDALDRSGEADNTFVVFAGDNGLAVGQHGLMGKQNLYDHSVRVPLIVAGPGVPKGRRASTLCHLMDVCPTIADLAGAPMPGSLEARSLVPVLKKPNLEVRDSVIAAYRTFQRSIRTGRHKLILYRVGGERTTQLFDLKADPLERKNLAHEQPRLVAELKGMLLRHLKEAGDPDPGGWA